MKRGPKPGARHAACHEANMRRAWEGHAPIWVTILARACDRSSLAVVGRKVGYSGAALSQAINAKYPGDVETMEKAVHACLPTEFVACEILGVISIGLCLAHQRQPFSTASPQTVKLARTCPQCRQHTAWEAFPE